MLGADDENHIDVMTEFPHRRLAVLCGVADVSDLWPDDVAVATFKRSNDAAGVVDAQRSLRDIGNGRIGRNIERRDVLFALHQHHGAVDLAERAFDLGMPGMADETEHATLSDVTLALVMDLRDQGAGRIEHRQLTAGSFPHHALCDAVRAEDGDGALRHLRELLDENGALGLEAVHDELVVHDLMAHVDRRPVFLEGALDDLNRAHHAGTESPRLCEHHMYLPAELLLARRKIEARVLFASSPLGGHGLGVRTAGAVSRLKRTHLSWGDRREGHDSAIFPHRFAQAQPKLL